MFRGIIYCYICKINSKYYIGQTINEYHRRYDFKTKDRYCTSINSKTLTKFDAARMKYGIENFEYNVLEELYFDNKLDLIRELNIKETYYIEKYDSFYSGYNSSFGGGSHILSNDHKLRISRSLMGHKMSELTKQRCTFKGHHHTEENRALISTRRKELYKDITNHPMYGKHHTEESKRKNSISRSGKCMGKENPNSRNISCYKDEIFVNKFDCLSDAIRWLNNEHNKNINPRQVGQISKCCSGKTKSAYGYTWKYND